MVEPVSMYEKYFKDPKREPVLIDFVRTPIGKKPPKGTIGRLRGDDLLIHCYETLLKRNEFDRELIGDSIVGCCSQIGECGIDIGRMVAVSTLPVSVPGMTVNRHCASGAQAVITGWQAIASGIHDCVICGGVEVQNRYPIGADADVYDPKSGKVAMIPPNKKILANPEVADTLKKYKMTLSSQINSAHYLGMAYAAKHNNLDFKDFENIRDNIRIELDELSYLSHKKSTENYDKRAKEIEPIWCPKLDETTGQPLLDEKNNIAQDPSLSELTEKDEGPRPGTSKEVLANLAPIKGIGRKKTAYLTAGNSCPTSDGACAHIWMTRKLAEELGFKPRATILNFASVGTDPILMLTGPIKAMPEALKRANMTWDDMDFIEINEAFSPVVYACCKDLGFEWTDPRFNAWGGAIALGHPTGMTGARLIATNVSQLEQTGKEYAISSMCVGFGMATATIVKREL